MAGNFGPVPGGSKILWQTDHFILYADSNGKCWRYMHEFHAAWPFNFDPPLVLPELGKYGLTKKEIEDLI